MWWNRWRSKPRWNTHFSSATKAGVRAALSGRWIAMNCPVSNWSSATGASHWIRSHRQRSPDRRQQPPSEPDVESPPSPARASPTHRSTTRRLGPRRRRWAQRAGVESRRPAVSRDPVQRRPDLPHSAQATLTTVRLWSESGKFWRSREYFISFIASAKLFKYTSHAHIIRRCGWNVPLRFTTSIAQLRQRNRASSAILRGWVTLRPNFRLKGYVSRQYLWIIRWGNGYTTILPLEVFTQRNFVADFIRLKLNFIKKQKCFWATLWGT